MKYQPQAGRTRKRKIGPMQVAARFLEEAVQRIKA